MRVAAVLCMAWTLALTGCAPPQAVRPPAVTPEMDQAARQAVYDQYKLTCEVKETRFVLPLFIFGTSIRFKRADGSYAPVQVSDLMESYPENRSMRRVHWDSIGVPVAAV